MKNKYPFLMILLLMGNILSAQKNPISGIPSVNYRPADFEYLSAPDSNGKRHVLKMPVTRTYKESNSLKLVYPVIFLHGATGSSDPCWDTTTNWMDQQYGLSFGGRIDFCLNYDANYSTANLNFYPTAGADISLFSDPNNLTPGDYYYLNFNVASDGMVYPISTYANNVKSNQAAVAKQGIALKWAVSYVLQKTGRDKVILMCHSMGGLAAREYLQNSVLWQADGKHHIAKLITLGTPHGGSNASLSLLTPYFTDIDTKSEAIRDLRTTYFYSQANGVYLFGGIENNSVMHDMLFSNFYNVDVNCNGITNESITGLNSKSIDYDIDYACIIGVASILDSGDYVVDNENANLTNFKPGITSNIFQINAVHTSLTNKNYENMQGLDEPNQFKSAYQIYPGIDYSGFISVQPPGISTFDYDVFKFAVSGNTDINVSITNIAMPDLVVRIVDNVYNTVGTVMHSSGNTQLNFTRYLNAGSYYLEVLAQPDTSSYLHAYKFRVNLGNGVDNYNKENSIAVYPNPANAVLNIENLDGKSDIRISSSDGKTIVQQQAEHNAIINVGNISKGLYLLQITNSKTRVYKKLIIE